MKVLLLGSEGMLGRAIAAAAPRGAIVAARNHSQLDVRDGGALDAAVREERPDWIFNCTGLTNVEAAEEDRATAFAVNADAVGTMGKVARTRGARVLHFSSDYVFDGADRGYYREEDATGPLNVYGESKLAGERQLQKSGADHLIIRTQWLFGMHGRSFVSLMCERAESRQATKAVDDETGCCTYAADLASAAWRLAPTARGILHVANRGKVSRYTLARRIFDHFGAAELLTSCRSAEFGATIRRPPNSALSIVRAEGILGEPMPGWENAIDRFLRERSNCAKDHKNPKPFR